MNAFEKAQALVALAKKGEVVMSLINHIKQHALQAAQAGDWLAVAATLNSLTTEVRDKTPVTYARIRELFGEPVRAVIAATIRGIAKSQSPLAGEMEDAHSVMLDEGVGLRLDLPERQQLLASIGASAGWEPALVSQIAALGVRALPILASPTTAQQCQSAFMKDNLEAIADAAYQQFVDRYNAAKAGIESGTLTTEQAVFAALEA